MTKNTEENKEAKENKETKAETPEEKSLKIVGTKGIDLAGFEDYAREDSTTGLEIIDQTDLKMPKVKLVQAQSEEHTKDDVPVGHYYNAVTKEHSETIECIMLALGKSRVMWPATFKRGDKPLCRSFDGVRKTEGIGDGICAKCQYSQWGEGGEKPDCNLGYVWLGVDSKNRPFRLNARGASMTPTKDFLNTVFPQLNRGGKQLGIFVFKLVLSSRKESNDKGTYYVMNYDIVGTIDKKDYSELEGMSASLRELFLKAIDIDNLTEGVEISEPDEGEGSPEGTLF